ncbi:PhoX family protein, partial [Effusibacillus consociatus]
SRLTDFIPFCALSEAKGMGIKMSQKFSRREFMTYMGVGTAAMIGAVSGLDKVAMAAGKTWEPDKAAQGIPSKFKPISRTRQNDVMLPQGFKYDIIATYGDVINSKGEKFGDSVDLTVYFPIDAVEGGNNSEEGLLWVNHEFPMPENYMKMLGMLGIVADKYENSLAAKYPDLLQMQKESVGGSVIRIKKENGTWKMIKDDKYNRRVHGNTKIELTGPASGSTAVKGAKVVYGSLGNCSGGRTLWNTVLSCEENTEYGKSYGWPDFVDEHYGWVVEVDPFNLDAPVRKHTALGRFAHENAAMGLTKDGRVVVYMGDDSRDEFFYKFISEKKFNPNNREANFSILESGTLYAADLYNGKWIALDYNKNEKLRTYKKAGANEPFFKSQADVVTFAREAGRAVGGTPMDRPEDVEIHPHDGTVYLSLTNNSKHGNFHGQILRFIPADEDHASDSFTFEVFAVGGQHNGFSCPDNLHFDSEGNLWVAEDYGDDEKVYEQFGNCAFLMIPTAGKNYGEAFQFLSGPVGSETTGPWFTPDEKTLFLNIQHPESWNPHPTHRFGRASTIAITGFKGV